VASFGFRYDYTFDTCQRADPVLEWLAPRSGRVEGFGGADLRFGQILCAECATSVSPRLAPRHKFLSRGGQVTDGPASRSMQRHDQSISGPRSDWEHSIPPVKGAALFDHLADDDPES
jgi:hypothetical protein